MAKKIKLGRFVELPLCALGGYVLSVALLCIGGAQQLGTALRVPLMVAAIIAFIAGSVIHVLHKLGEHNTEMLLKIECSIGDVWDSGERAGVRHQTLRQMERHAVVVHSEPRLAVVPDSGSC